MKKLVELFCDVDDFYKVFIPQWQNQLLQDGSRQRRRESRMTVSEVMTVIIGFHMPIIEILKIIILVMSLTFIKMIS
tara:strand:+ start:1823 stop:2053 length:231 start_codon:yes stop_codon:yes gene_type:complete